MITLIGAIIGAISGGAGIFIAWYTSKLKDNEWMKQNVYARLYDWVASRENTFRFNDEYAYVALTTPPLTPSQYSMLDKKIREKFDAHANEGEKLYNQRKEELYDKKLKRLNRLIQ